MIYSFLMKILVSCANDMGIFGANLDKINLDDNNNIYEDDPGTTIHVRLLTWQKI